MAIATLTSRFAAALALVPFVSVIAGCGPVLSGMGAASGNAGAYALGQGLTQLEAAELSKSTVNVVAPQASAPVSTPAPTAPPIVKIPRGVICEPDGRYRTAPGYDWANDVAGDLRVRWVPGTPHPDHDHVVAGSQPDTWDPEPGYRWADPDSRRSFEVVRETK